MLIRELTKELKDSYTIWLKGIPTAEFCDSLSALPGIKVCIIEEITDNPDFRMSDLLNFLDGESSLKNAIIIATTNYPENLKQNLADRPSRFDIVFEVGNPTPDQGRALIAELLKEPALQFNSLWDFRPNNLSFAQLKELVLLHKLHGIPLEEAQARLLNHKEAFKRGFMEVKKVGF